MLLIIPSLPNANPDIFINYIDSSIDKIQRGQALCYSG